MAALFAAALIQKEQKFIEAEIQKAVARNEDVARLYERLYEDNVSGNVTDEWFMQISHKYEVERMELKQKIAELREKLNNVQTIRQSKEDFTRAVRKFLEMLTLIAPLLHELIERIDVYHRG